MNCSARPWCTEAKDIERCSIFSRVHGLRQHKQQPEPGGNYCRADGHIAATRPFAAKVRQAKTHAKSLPSAENDNKVQPTSEERLNAWFDARLAPALPPDHRTRRQDSWPAGGRDALD